MWDAVLAQSPHEFELLDYLCVAVLVAVREPLLKAKDCPSALEHLTGGVMSFGMSAPIACGQVMLVSHSQGTDDVVRSKCGHLTGDISGADFS